MIGIIIQEAENRTWISISNNCKATAGMLRYYSSEDLGTCYIIECKYESVAFNIWALIEEKFRDQNERSNWYRMINAEDIYNEYQNIADEMIEHADERTSCTTTKRTLEPTVTESISSSSDSSLSTEATPPLKRTKANFAPL